MQSRSVPRRICRAALMIAVAGCCLNLEAQSIPPQILAPTGSSPLGLVGHARRAHLAGVEDLYSIALYGPDPFDRAAIGCENTPKALRIEITYERDWRRPAIIWHTELVPRIEPGLAGHLDRVFVPLRRGDIVLMEYASSKGTTVRINRTVAVSGAGHELMLAFLDHWLGQRPVSEEVKHALLGR